GDGRSQVVGVDCDETFNPVVKPATIRTILSIALSKDHQTCWHDILQIVSHHVDTKHKLSTSFSTPYEDPSLYRSLAGALQYHTFTRSDISYAVQQVCLHMHAPHTEHMIALKRILRYVQGTIYFGLHLSPPPITKLVSYTDADYGGSPDTRRSTSGYCVFLGDNLI
ncbi:hypothetical protein A2U01_0021644, partial [Trifolium medium]|nr:hypothetical protein [Trifolium medium]